MQVQGVVTNVRPVKNLLPAFATVPASNKAAHFNGPIHIHRIRRVGGQSDHPLAQGRHVGGYVGKNYSAGVHLLPVLATVFRAGYSAWLIAGINYVRVLRMERQRPYIASGGVQGLPVL